MINDQLTKLIWRTAWPAALEMVLIMMIGIADVAFVGRLGGAPLAGIALGAEIVFGVLLTLNALGVGATVLAAQYTGAGETEKVNEVAAQTLLIGALIGIIAGFAGYYASPDIIGLFNVEPEVASIAVAYMQIAFTMTPVALCLYMGNSVFRGTGMTKVPLTIALITNVVNIFLIYVLVFGQWGFPAMGGPGSAMATVISHCLGFILFLAAAIYGRWHVKLDPWQLLKPSRTIIVRILKLGLPSSVEEFLRTFNIVVSSYLLVGLGTSAFAAHQIAVTVESISFMPGFGFAIAATAVTGQMLGAQKTEEARKAVIRSLGLASLVMGAAAIVFILAPEQIAGLFTTDVELISLAAVAIFIAGFEQLSLATEFVYAGTLRGAGDTRTPMVVSFLGMWLLRLPGLYVAIYVLHWGLAGVWAVFVMDWTLRALVMYILVRRFDWERGMLLKQGETVNAVPDINC